MQGAAVIAQENETGLTRSTTTDQGRNYVLLELPVGHYRMEIAPKNFQKYVQEGISLNVNDLTRPASPMQ